MSRPENKAGPDRLGFGLCSTSSLYLGVLRGPASFHGGNLCPEEELRTLSRGGSLFSSRQEAMSRMHTEDGYLWLSEDLTHAGGRGGCAGGEIGTCESQNQTEVVGDTWREPPLPPLVRLQLLL